jgi:hypothetical protein
MDETKRGGVATKHASRGDAGRQYLNTKVTKIIERCTR